MAFRPPDGFVIEYSISTRMHLTGDIPELMEQSWIKSVCWVWNFFRLPFFRCNSELQPHVCTLHQTEYQIIFTIVRDIHTMKIIKRLLRWMTLLVSSIYYLSGQKRGKAIWRPLNAITNGSAHCTQRHSKIISMLLTNELKDYKTLPLADSYINQ